VIVVDSSVVLQWLLDEPQTQAAQLLLERPDELIAPDILFVEVGNVLGKKVRAREISADQAMESLAFVAASVPRLLGVRSLVTKALELSIELSHPLYDCMFLAAAIDNACQLATRDDVFVKRATSRGRGGSVRLLQSPANQ
jgi:predicted nucleic acid-binding protein